MILLCLSWRIYDSIGEIQFYKAQIRIKEIYQKRIIACRISMAKLLMSEPISTA